MTFSMLNSLKLAFKLVILSRFINYKISYELLNAIRCDFAMRFCDAICHTPGVMRGSCIRRLKLNLSQFTLCYCIKEKVMNNEV